MLFFQSSGTLVLAGRRPPSHRPRRFDPLNNSPSIPPPLNRYSRDVVQIILPLSRTGVARTAGGVNWGTIRRTLLPVPFSSISVNQQYRLVSDRPMGYSDTTCRTFPVRPASVLRLLTT